MTRVSFGRRIVDGITMFVVTGLSLLLLVYVGFGEGKRIYEQFQIEKLVAHGQIVQNAMENYLRAGLPLKQFAGFSTLADPIVQSLEDMDAMAVYDQAGNQLYIVVDKDKPQPKLPDAAALARQIKHNVEVDKLDTFHQVVLPLRTRFEVVGSLVITASNDYLNRRLEKTFSPVLTCVAGLSAVFAIFVVFAAPYLARARAPWLQIAYAVTFLVMAGLVVATLINLYSDGVQTKAKASAQTLAQRLSDIVEFNLRLRDLDGLDRVLADYRRLNPEISDVALAIDGTIQIASDPSRVGKAWISDSRNYEYSVALTAPGNLRKFTLTVAVPVDLVYQRVERSVRNFAALFIASGFLAGLFLQVASSMQRLKFNATAEDGSPKATVSEETALIVVKPIFFLAVFLEHLTYSFLPKFMQDAAVASDMSIGFAAAPFTAYYLCFALSLIPAGHFADRFGPKPLIWPGLILATVSILGLLLPIGIFEMTALRALSGIGQGMLFIGIQTYILAVASPEKKTQGNAIIVFGFQGGMISGMAIGSLLVTYLHPHGVFAVCAAIGMVTAFYSVLLIPGDIKGKHVEAGLGAAIRRVGERPEEGQPQRRIPQDHVLHRRARQGDPDRRDHVRAAAAARSAGVPAGGDRSDHHALRHRRGGRQHLRVPRGRSHRQHRSDPVLGRRRERDRPGPDGHHGVVDVPERPCSARRRSSAASSSSASPTASSTRRWSPTWPTRSSRRRSAPTRSPRPIASSSGSAMSPVRSWSASSS